MEQNPNQRSRTSRSGWRENTRLVLATALLSGSAFAADDARILELEKRINELEKQNKTQEATISTLQDDAEQQRDGMQQLFNLTKDINQGIRVSGFLSAAVAQVAIEEELQWGNEGPDNEVDWNSDSIVGLQISYSVTERLSAVLQMVSKGGFNSEFDADWFYLHYNFNESFSIMAGRIRPQFFMMSDYVEVGFTYPWIRPPVEVYDPIPTDVGQGVSFNYVTHWDDWEFRAHLQALQSEDQGTVSQFDAQILVAAFELSYNDWTLGLRKSNMQVDVLLQNEVLRRGSSILEQIAIGRSGYSESI
ncbi:hypothetical protein OLMES_1648 [Oleiphilus messinensis]|uniref:Uncharacterized protein n=1 Tax=Oleiphilus messinensis TaxID=141451 RepID=A0A1Y0I8J8_9GAMM|nr:hypothetical protein [Oleiphilus messinensis]ARU55723.1 hypothetical protein OLMES_1648 [Oleiphilus messinensis]